MAKAVSNQDEVTANESRAWKNQELVSQDVEEPALHTREVTATKSNSQTTIKQMVAEAENQKVLRKVTESERLLMEAGNLQQAVLNLCNTEKQQSTEETAGTRSPVKLNDHDPTVNREARSAGRIIPINIEGLEWGEVNEDSETEDESLPSNQAEQAIPNESPNVMVDGGMSCENPLALIVPIECAEVQKEENSRSQVSGRGSSLCGSEEENERGQGLSAGGTVERIERDQGLEEIATDAPIMEVPEDATGQLMMEEGS
ncbi:hypothetical protein R1sor_000601 [Riccia sorocarpa]|uniref:Uncharacterized protein n=1 Tax=Riccia sorocarpa TaxID=122646 RepID=A0ABD3GZK4_9MARC